MGLACRLDRVLTSKNLIYLINLQFYCVNTSYPMFFFVIILMYYIQSIYNIYISTHLLIFGFCGGPAGQPPLAPNGKALNQPKPYP